MAANTVCTFISNPKYSPKSCMACVCAWLHLQDNTFVRNYGGLIQNGTQFVGYIVLTK